jgi:arylsulfatase A
MNFFAAAVAVLLAATSLGVAADPKPNVIFIMADDQGSVDLGCYGAKDLRTPATDALAARGLRFTQFYAGAPVCTPSRACTLTGRYPMRFGLLGNASSHAGQPGGMPANEVTLAEVFKSAGYATGHIGKWHLGYEGDTRPNSQGFDFSFGHMGGCIDNYSHFYFWNGPNVHDLHRNGVEIFENGAYFPDLMLREAKAFIAQNGEHPFFLYYAINTPHYPYQGEPKWLETFKDLPYPRNLYAAFIASQDERVGKLLAAVDDAKLREKTIVIFQSDNGHSTEERAHFGGGSAGDYRGAKFSLFEGGVRVPAIISWPGQLPQNETRDQLVHTADWMPTLGKLCGLELPKAQLDGHDLSNVLRANAASPRTTVHWQTGTGPNAQWAIRDGDWKLIVNAQDTTTAEKVRVPVFLSNLKDDPGEKTNLAEQRPEIVTKLRQLDTDLRSNYPKEPEAPRAKSP